MNKKVLLITFCALVMLFVVATIPTGMVVKSNTCCTNPDLCSSEELCDSFNPSLENPSIIANGNNATYAIGVLLLLTCMGAIHKAIAPKEKV